MDYSDEEVEKATGMLMDKLMSESRLRHKELAIDDVRVDIQNVLDATWEPGFSLEKWVDDGAAHYAR